MDAMSKTGIYIYNIDLFKDHFTLNSWSASNRSMETSTRCSHPRWFCQVVSGNGYKVLRPGATYSVSVFFPHLARRIVWTGFNTMFSLIEDTCCNSKGPLHFDDRHPTAVASSISKAWSPMAPISLNQVWLAMQKKGGVSLIHIIFMWRNVSFFRTFWRDPVSGRRWNCGPLTKTCGLTHWSQNALDVRHVEISAGNRPRGWSITCSIS